MPLYLGSNRKEIVANFTTTVNGNKLPTLTNPGSANDLIQDKQLIDESGSIITGSMVDNGAVNATLNTVTTSYTIPAGKHSGSGKVSISVEDRTFTPFLIKFRS